MTSMTDFEGTMTTVSPQSRPAIAPASALAADWRQPAIAAVILFGCILLIFWNFIERQVRWAIEQQADWGHTLIVPIIAGYFIYLNRDKILAKPFKTTWIGLVPVVVGVAWYIECCIGLRPLNHHNLQGFGLFLTLSGLSLLFLGWRAMRWMWFPLLYVFFFGQTISERLLNIVTFQMQDITAQGAAFLLRLGADVDRSGNTLYMHINGEQRPLNIAEACSGMRMLMAFLALGVAMAYTGLRMFWQQAALVILAVPVSIFVNILRVVTLGILSLYDAGLAAGDFHSFIGLVWLVPAFLIFLGVIWVLRQLVVDEPGSRTTKRPMEARSA